MATSRLRDAPANPFAQAGHDRAPANKGIVGGGMRIIRQGIEEQVRQAWRAKMLVELHSVRVDPIAPDRPARDASFSQILLGRWVRAAATQTLASVRRNSASRYRTSAA